MKSCLLLVLEFGPIAAFFILVKTCNIYIATAIFMLVSCLGVICKYLITKKISYILIFSSSVLVIMGSLTLIFKNPSFIKMKPTIFYCLCAVLCYIGAINDRIFMKDILVDVKMSQENWLILSKRIALLCTILAILNESVWRILGQDAWVNYKFFVTPIILIIFSIMQKKFIDLNKITEN